MKDGAGIRPFVPADGPLLGAWGRSLFPPWLPRLLLPGRAWVLQTGQGPAGAAAFAPLPGLPGVAEVAAFVLPAWRGQGWGQQLLQTVIQGAQAAGMRQLSQAVPSLDSLPATFLLHFGFVLEHEEWLLRLDEPGKMPAASWPPDFAPRTLARQAAIRRFRALYDASFGPHPWYQPYSQAEVEEALGQPHDLLFLCRGEEPVGFAWLRQAKSGVGEIEPFGLVPAVQGQGLGRALLRAAVAQLVARGNQAVEVGAWRTNHTALHLYQQCGFVKAGSQFYLARSLVPGTPP